MLDSSCANACALNGLPGPMRHWFTGFTHTHSTTGNQNRNPDCRAMTARSCTVPMQQVRFVGKQLESSVRKRQAPVYNNHLAVAQGEEKIYNSGTQPHGWGARLAEEVAKWRNITIEV